MATSATKKAKESGVRPRAGDIDDPPLRGTRQDITLWNLRAIKKRFDALERRVQRLERQAGQ